LKRGVIAGKENRDVIQSNKRTWDLLFTVGKRDGQKSASEKGLKYKGRKDRRKTSSSPSEGQSFAERGKKEGATQKILRKCDAGGGCRNLSRGKED